ncbi:MAG TPA: pentapeptide repeat-containing protein [Chloroflexia bacterium]|nr:pentapeptide repeat-containing protein [Chloroflexia bacterium]
MYDKSDLSDQLSSNTAKLTEANLRGAILRNADLTDAHLTRARLDDADFSRAKLAGAYFLGVNLSQQLKETIANSGAIGLESTVFDPEVLTSHPPVDLRSRGGSADLRTRSLDNTGPLRAMPALTPPAPSTPSSVPAPLAPVSVTTEDSTIQVRIVEEPLTSQQLTRIISVLTELHSKCWLISQGRFVAVMDYVQTGNSELVREARLVISRLQYDRVAEIDLKVYPGIKEIIGALETAITSITQTPFALKEASLNEQANRLEKELKRLGMQLVYTENSAPFTPDSFYPNNSELPKEYSTNGTEEWKGDLEKQKRLFELERERFKLQNDLERQKLELEKERLALQMERLAVEKNSLNYALQTAERMVDRLHPGVNSSIKGILSQALLPQLLQLQSLTEVEEIKVQNSPNQSESK